MAQVLESIISFFSGIVTFLSNIINGLIQLIITIPNILRFLGIAMGALPSMIAVFAVAFISTSVVYLVLGR